MKEQLRASVRSWCEETVSQARSVEQAIDIHIDQLGVPLPGSREWVDAGMIALEEAVAVRNTYAPKDTVALVFHLTCTDTVVPVSLKSIDEVSSLLSVTPPELVWLASHVAVSYRKFLENATRLLLERLPPHVTCAAYYCYQEPARRHELNEYGRFIWLICDSPTAE